MSSSLSPLSSPSPSPSPPSSSSSSPALVKSPESDVSPGSQPSDRAVDYFSTQLYPPLKSKPTARTGFAIPSRIEEEEDVNLSDDTLGGKTAAAAEGTTPTGPSPSPSPAPSSLNELVRDDSRRSSNNGSDNPTPSLRSSVGSVKFRPPRNPSLPQGHKRTTDARRLRESSPSPVRFKPHVGFDNLPVGDATKHNTSSFTLNVRHQGYHPKRRSRTFMVGVDDHDYSNYALVWLLDSLVDDGDEVVCVRVIENPVRLGEKSYQDDAKRMLRTIQDKNKMNKAISIVLEYAAGKLHDTFQQLIQIYQPSMLIVGTRGRSLGGFQGLVGSARNSFSKYCLQYSPVPVVVVRPDDQRQKKKDKRSNDPTRQSYAQMLVQNAGKHEADSEASSMYELERSLSPDEEAHHVAAAIGLPAAFDPTIKPYDPRSSSRSRRRALSPDPVSSPPLAPAVRSSPRVRSPPPENLDNESEEEESADEDEGEFEVADGRTLVSRLSGKQLQDQKIKRQKAREEELHRMQKQRLHAMEVGEAAALLKSGAVTQDADEDEDDEESPGGSNGAKT